jgi:hypothetical protein
MKRSLATDDVWMSTNPDREEMDRQNFPSDSSNCIGSPFFDDKVLDVEVERTSNTDMTSNNSERLIVTDRMGRNNPRRARRNIRSTASRSYSPGS